MGFKGSQVIWHRRVPDLPGAADTLLFIPLFQIVGWLGLINNTWVLVLLSTRRWRCRSAPGS